jgi:hypothetical protein
MAISNKYTLPVSRQTSLDFPFFIALSVFYDVYIYCIHALNMRIFVAIADFVFFLTSQKMPLIRYKTHLVSIQFCTSSFNEILFSVVLCV